MKRIASCRKCLVMVVVLQCFSRISIVMVQRCLQQGVVVMLWKLSSQFSFECSCYICITTAWQSRSSIFFQITLSYLAPFHVSIPCNHSKPGVLLWNYLDLTLVQYNLYWTKPPTTSGFYIEYIQYIPALLSLDCN